MLELQRTANIVPVNLIHRSKEEVTIKGHRFPARVRFCCQIYSVLSEETVFEEPSLFKPERFLEKDGVTLNQDLASKIIPFGIGKRQCAGEGLARAEIFLMATAIVQRYQLSPSKEAPIDLSPHLGSNDFSDTLLVSRYLCSTLLLDSFQIPERTVVQISPNQLHLDVERYRKVYGDFFTIWLMETPVIFICDLETIKEALVTHGENLSDRNGKYPETLFVTVENGGVIFSSGDNWKEQRRTALHILRDFGVGKNIMETMVHSELYKLFENIDEQNDNSLDLKWPIQVAVANIINQLLYGFAYPHNDCSRLIGYTEKLNACFSEMWETLWPLIAQLFPFVKHLPYAGYKAYGEHKEKYDYCVNFVKSDVNNALKGYETDDEPACFVQAYQRQMETNPFLDLDNLYNTCCDFFFAGMETSTTTLRWAVLFLAQYPDVQEKMRKEIERVIGKDRLPSLTDRSKLPYTAAVMLELQRTANIVPVNLIHRSKEEVTINGHHFLAKTRFCCQIYSVLSEETVFEAPSLFKPERFLEKDGVTLNQIIPFGIGRRQCAGEGLARAEIFLMATAIVQRYQLSPSKEAPIDLSPHLGSVLQPKPNKIQIKRI